MSNKSTPTKKDIIEWLDNQVTDMKYYDARDDMDEGEHMFGAIMRGEAKERQNRIVAEIKRLLVDAFFEDEVLR